MRPDQHKKKKNLEYKKKHGISANKRDKYEKNEATRGSRSDDRRSNAAVPEQPEGRREFNDALPDATPVDEHRSFSRRKVESNWDRYKEDENEESCGSNQFPAATRIGTDYQALLSQASNATTSSHFQFSSEKEWGNINKENIASEAGYSLMSIDCIALAQALEKIPMEQRLGLDKKFLENHQKLSDLELLRIYSSFFNKEEHFNSDDHRSFEKHPVGRLTIVKDQNGQDQLKQNDVRNEIKLTFSKPKELFQSCEKTEQNMKLDLDETKVLEQQQKKQNCKEMAPPAEDSDLELLLGITSCTEHPQNTKETTEKPQAWETKKAEFAPQEKCVSDCTTKEDLEDWLDSILD